MITLTHYRKFIEKRKTTLIWRWNKVRRDEFYCARYYCAVVTDGLRHHILRRKCHTAEDALKYGARMTQKVNGFVDVDHSALVSMNNMAAAR